MSCFIKFILFICFSL